MSRTTWCPMPALCSGQQLIERNESGQWDLVRTVGWVASQRAVTHQQARKLGNGIFVCYSGSLRDGCCASLLERQLALITSLRRTPTAGRISIGLSLRRASGNEVGAGGLLIYNFFILCTAPAIDPAAPAWNQPKEPIKTTYLNSQKTKTTPETPQPKPRYENTRGRAAALCGESQRARAEGHRLLTALSANVISRRTRAPATPRGRRHAVPVCVAALRSSAGR